MSASICDLSVGTLPNFSAKHMIDDVCRTLLLQADTSGCTENSRDAAKQHLSSHIASLRKDIQNVERVLTETSASCTPCRKDLYEQAEIYSPSLSDWPSINGDPECVEIASPEKPYRRRLFPRPRFVEDKAQQEAREEGMDIENRIILFSRLLNDLEMIPNIDVELTHWEKKVVKGANFWAGMSQYGAVPWYGRPTHFKLAMLPLKVSESGRMRRKGFKEFHRDFVHGRLPSWPRLIEPEYSFLQGYFDERIEDARLRQNQGISSKELKKLLYIPYDILHCLQLTFRNLAVEYIQMETELKNTYNGRPIETVPLEYGGNDVREDWGLHAYLN